MINRLPSFLSEGPPGAGVVYEGSDLADREPAPPCT